jgi:hypothetical protein
VILSYWISDEYSSTLLTDYKYNDILILKYFDIKSYERSRPTRHRSCNRQSFS